MLVTHDTLIKHIINHDSAVAIWGLSLTTKDILQSNPLLRDAVTCIIDNDSSLHNTTFRKLPIVSLQKSLQYKNLFIAIWGNHISDIVVQLRHNHFTNFLIDYEHSKNYLPKSLTITLDYLKKNNDPNDFNYKFCNTVIEYCIENSLECHIKPFLWWKKGEKKENIINDHLLYNKKAPKDTLLFSYHTIGDSNPQIFRWKESYLYNTITFDTNGYSGWSSLAQNPELVFSKVQSQRLVQNHFEKLQNKYVNKNLSKYQQTHSDFQFPEQFIFFPLQTFDDTVMLHSYFNPFDLLQDIVTILNKKNIPLVIKRHPRCENKKLQKLLLKYENQKKIILFSGSIHDALAKASTVYVINSGVGFEALIHLKPVITFGKSDYMQVTKNIKNLAELNTNPWHELSQENEEKIKQFLYYYTNEKSIEIGKAKIKKKVHSFVIDYINKEHYASSFK